MIREITLGADELVHPQVLNGRPQFVSNEAADLIHKMHYGDPTIGWQGDPRLALYHDAGGRWVLERLEADGVYRPVCRSRPGLPLDERLLFHLMRHDMRHHDGFDPDALEEADRPYDRDDERLNEAIERFAHGLQKDLA